MHLPPFPRRVEREHRYEPAFSAVARVTLPVASVPVHARELGFRDSRRAEAQVDRIPRELVVHSCLRGSSRLQDAAEQPPAFEEGVCDSCSLSCSLAPHAAVPRRREATGYSASGTPAPPIYRLDELTWPEIDSFDRARTLFILPVGMLEQHGPHLPAGADTLAVVYEANAVAQQVSRASAGWNIVMMPTVAYGHSGANQLGDLPIHPGTYALRQSTFRALLADIGSQLAQNGFRWIFVLNGHGAPSHGIATDDACDFVSERFGVTMLDVSALFRADPRDSIARRGDEPNILLGRADRILRYGRPCRCRRDGGHTRRSTGPCFTGIPNATEPSRDSFEELRAVATAPGWQGYLSSPALATPEYGAAVERWWIDGFSELILRAIRGEDMSRGYRARPSSSRRLSHRSSRTRARERGGIRSGVRRVAVATSAVGQAHDARTQSSTRRRRLAFPGHRRPRRRLRVLRRHDDRAAPRGHGLRDFCAE